MLKHITALATACLLFGTSASAQSASDIEKVRSGKSCKDCNLFQADFSYEGINDLDLSGSRLRQADLSLSSMTNVNFADSNLSVANLFGGQFTSSNFSGANLSDSTLVGGYFTGANFSGADLSGTNLGGAKLQDAHGLTQRQLNKACGDTFTRLRDGLTIPRCK